MKFEDGLTARAWMMRDTGADFNQYLPLQEKAVEMVRAGLSHEDPVAVLEQMAFFLYAEGRMAEAVAFYNEAVDTMRAHPERLTTEGTIQLFGDLSLLYARLGMDDKAVEFMDSAMAASRRLGGVMMSDLWRFRSEMYADADNMRMAYECLDSAYEAIKRGEHKADSTLLRSVIDAERAGLILSGKTTTDSVCLAISLLEGINSCNLDHDYAEYRGPLGYAYYLLGQKQRGIALMEQALDELRRRGDLEVMESDMRTLIEVYSAEKMWDKVESVFGEYLTVSDSMSRARHDLDLVCAQVRADVAVKDKENEFLHERLKIERNEKTAIGAAFVLFGIIVLNLSVMAVRSYRRMKQRRLSAEATVTEAMSEKNAALERIEVMKSDMANQLASGTDILQNPQCINSSNRGQFQRVFNAVNPNFVADLLHDFPTLTDTDELICMLIYLNHRSDEIATYLNISKASVNTARYRIRTKLNLSKTDNLDTFLQSRRP